MSSLVAISLVLVPSTLVLAALLRKAKRSPSPHRAARTGRASSRRPRQRAQDELEFFHPADLMRLAAPTPECEGLFPLARDVHGNLYVVDPCQPDPVVMRIDPRASERRVVSRSLSEFLRR